MDGIRDTELPIRLLRSFVAVAEELSFTKAADRLFVAQQAISRDVRQLEARLGKTLFVRSTRHVTLTPEGQQLLRHARELVRLHDRIVDEMGRLQRPIVVDLLSEGRLTGPRILEAMRSVAPDIEFRSRYGGGTAPAVRQLQRGELDVAIGRVDWLGHAWPDGLDRRLIRLEPLAVLLPPSHPLAGDGDLPMAALSGLEIDVNPAHPEAIEWSDLARQLLAMADAHATPAHASATSLDDQADHLIRQGLPILTAIDHLAVPGGVIRQLVEPVALYPWSIAWRRSAHPALVAAILAVMDALAGDADWLTRPARSWLPEPEAAREEA